jgi:hypothetical protein
MPYKQQTTSTFVSAQEPARSSAPTSAAVSAKWRDNLGVWIGSTTVLVALQWLWCIVGYAVGWRQTWWPSRTAFQMWTLAAALIGAVLFGLLMMWRSALDERERAGEFLWLRSRVDELNAELEEADATITELEYKLQRAQVDLKEQYTQMQAMMAMDRQFVASAPAASKKRIPLPLYRDAVMLADLSLTPPREYSRDKTCRKFGWTTTRWYAARDVLVAAGIWQTDGKATAVKVQNRATAQAQLALYAGHNETGEKSDD